MAGKDAYTHTASAETKDVQRQQDYMEMHLMWIKHNETSARFSHL